MGGEDDKLNLQLSPYKVRGPKPGKHKYIKKRRINLRVPSVLTMTMAPTSAGRVISSARCPGMWEVNDRWSYGFPTCMGGILLGRTVRGAHLIKLQHNY